MSTSTLLAVTGSPILHSRSPVIFNHYFTKNNLDSIYFRMSSDSAKESIETYKDLRLKGMNVTAPFKNDIIQYLDIIDKDAAIIGAVNTVTTAPSGKLHGYNTDYLGIINSISDNNIDISGKKCVVIGAGGTGRAAVHALTKSGGDVIIINRTYSKAKEIASIFNCKAEKIENLEIIIRKAHIIISTLSADINLMKKDWLNSNQLVFDVNYKSSSLLETAKSKACIIATGKQLLVNQAIPGFNHLFGYTPEESFFSEAINKENRLNKNCISLIGFMGTGKSIIGKKLALLSGYTYIDTDQLIEEKARKTIVSIFKDDGEKRFREIEKEVLNSVVNKEKVILSCGGGIIESKENRMTLIENTLPIWLFAPMATCIERNKGNSRPLLNVENPQTKAEELFKHRKAYYAETAAMLINTKHYSPENAAKKIRNEIEILI